MTINIEDLPHAELEHFKTVKEIEELRIAIQCKNFAGEPFIFRTMTFKDLLERYQELMRKEGLSWDDREDEYTAAINDAHPLQTGYFELHGRAMKMVGNRHSKAALVDLVNWLLLEKSKSDIYYTALKKIIALVSAEAGGAVRIAIEALNEEILPIPEAGNK